MHLGLQTHARHAERLAHAFLVIDHVFLRKDMQHLLIGRNRHGLAGIQYPLDIGLDDLTVTDGNDAVGIEAADVVAGQTREYRVDLAAGHELGFFYGALDRLDGGLDVDHYALLQAAGRMRADTDDLQFAVRADFADERDHFGGANIQSDYHPGTLLASHILLRSPV